jgi:Fe-Mn family superoxide dismutase
VAWVVLAWRPAPGRLGHVLLPAGAAPPGRWPDAQVSQRHALLALTPQTLAAPLDWANVYARYQAAVQHDSTPWAAGRQQVGGAVLVDVRRAAVYAQAETQLPGAHWRNPAQVDQWAGTLPAGRPVLVYCVYGHEVSRATALRLRAAGVDARFLDGGLHAWQAAGGPLAPRPRG